MCSLGEEWHISSAGNDIITENNSIKDRQRILNLVLNSDLKEICDPALSNELPKELISKIVLQIQKIRNISAPKANEESQAAPRMLKLNLTDGHTFIQALEISPINAISRNRTPPGSKVLINNAKIVSGYLLLNANNCTLLGGKVPHLVEKWEVAKSITRTNRRTSCEDGPPPWVNFGAKIQTGTPEAGFSSLGKNKDSKENSEFEMQRQGAIAEAATGATRKIFGGRVKQNIQTNTCIGTQNKSSDKRDHIKSKNRNVSRDQEVEEKPSKPSEKVSLFSFLEDKLPVSEISKKTEYSENVSTSQNKNDEFKRYGSLNTNYYNSRQFHSQLGNNERPYHHNKIENRLDESSGQNNKPNSHFNKSNHNNNSSYNQNSHNQNLIQSSYKSQRSDEHHTTIVGNQVEKLLQNKTNANSNASRTDQQIKSYDKDINSSHNQYGSSYQLKGEISDSRQNKRNEKSFENQQKPSEQGKWYVNPNISQNHQGNQSEINSGRKNEKAINSYKTSSQHQRKTNTINDKGKPEKDLQQTMNSANSNISVNSQFASRSLRQHLNLGPVKKSAELVKKSEEVVKEKYNADSLSLSIGDEILAKYWEDGKFYNATITAVTDKTYAVKFKGYGNIEEIFKHDCLPVQSNIHKLNNNYRQNRQYGSMEFRRSNRNYN